MSEMIFDLQRFNYIRNDNVSVRVYGSDGDDIIVNTDDSPSVTIDAGAGNDSINIGNSNSAYVIGGTGDDTIRFKTYYNAGPVIQYSPGDGNDYILEESFKSAWTLKIGDGSDTYSSQTSGSDIIVTVGEGQITLVGGASSKVNIAGRYSTNSGGNSKLITGTEYADTINNSIDGATINALGGNDYIENSGGVKVIIKSGDGDDTVRNIFAYDANYDKWYNPDSVSIDTGTGNDSVSNVNDNYATINTGEGNDYVFNSYGNYATINTGAGNDSIYNQNFTSATINTGEGNDYVDDYISDSTAINTGSGNDSVYSEQVRNATINTGSGDDLISLSTESGFESSLTVIQYSVGDGNDLIEGFTSTDTLQIGNGSGTYSTTKSGNDLILTVGDGKISLIGAATLSTVNIAGTYSAGNDSSDTSKLLIYSYGADYVNNSITGATISALGGDDTIINDGGTSVSINGGAGNDSILSWVDSVTTASNSTIDGGAGNDTIYSYGSNVTISGGTGNDSIENNGHYVSISGGTGNDTLHNYNGDNVTISGGAGNDSILTNYAYAIYIDSGDGDDSIANGGSNSTIIGGTGDDDIENVGENILFKYNDGDGNDTIHGFNETTTLRIGNGTYSTQVSGSDIIVTVGEGKIILVDAASLEEINIDGVESELPAWRINGTTATYGTSTNTQITVSGVKSTDGLSLNGSTVTVANSALNQQTVTISNGYTLALANDVTKTSAKAAGWSLSGTTATYKNSATTAGYKLSNNQIVYSKASGGETLITVTGVKSLDGISISQDSKTITIANASLNQSNVTINDGYTLALANDVPTPNPKAAGWSLSGNTATYKNTSTSAGYKLSDNQIVYSKASGGETLITVTGVKSLDGISISQDGKTITIANASLNQSNVTINDGYTLALNYDVPLAKSTAAHWTHSGTTATYKSDSTTAGYSVVSNQIVYTAAQAETDLVEVKGVKSSKGLTLDGKIVTVGAAALNQSTVTISNGYTLALANDVTETATTAEGWTLEGTTAIYKSAATTAGYKLNANNQISYVGASGGETLITVKGVKSLDSISLNGKTVTVAASSLNKTDVTLTGDGYKLELDDKVSNPATTEAWNYKSSKATYNQTTTAGYTLASNNSITYSKKATTGLVTVSGVKSASGLSADIKKKVVTVGKAALGTDNKVTIDNGYKLKLGSSVSKPTTKKASWSLSNSTATYKSSYKTAGYKLSDNKISYTAATTAKGLATVKGAKSKSFSVSGDKITLKNSALKNKVTVSGGYNFYFASDYKNATITGSTKGDTITTNGNNLLVSGGKNSDTLKIFGKKTTVKGGDGKDIFVFNKSASSNVISDYAAGDKISVEGTAKVSASGKSLIFTVGSGKLTVTGGKDKKVSFIDSSGENIYDYKAGVKTSSTTIAFLKSYQQDSFKLADNNEIQTIDASAVTHEMSIMGNKQANRIIGSEENDSIDGGAAKDFIIGGDGNDTLIGGKGNDTLTGGAGSDVFIYAKDDGDDIITDYNEEDRIKITSGKASVTKKNQDVIFTVGNGKIKVKGAADKVVTYIDANGKKNYYPASKNGSYIVNGTSVKVLEEYKSETFDVANVKDGKKVIGNTIKRIDVSQVSHDLEVVGNSNNNVILGGKGDDTIYGGKGNDTLQGGEGKNIFVYKSGDDQIVDYGAGDMISLESGTVSNVSVKGSDSIIKVGKNKITVVGGADKVVTIADKKGNDTIISSKGNDTLWGNAGKDTFLYDGGGKDIIYGFDNADMLQIMGTFSGTYNKSKKEVYFKVGSTARAITLKDFTATSFNVNGKNYKINGSNLK